MAEALIMLVEQGAHPMLYKRFDVVTIQEDGWAWSPEELNHPRWMVVSVPGVPAAQLSALTAQDPGDINAGTLAQLRAQFFDVDAWIADGRPAIKNLASALKYRKIKPAFAG